MALSHSSQTVLLLLSFLFRFVIYFLFRRFVVLETLPLRRFVLPSRLLFSYFCFIVFLFPSCHFASKAKKRATQRSLICA